MSRLDNDRIDLPNVRAQLIFLWRQGTVALPTLTLQTVFSLFKCSNQRLLYCNMGHLFLHISWTFIKFNLDGTWYSEPNHASLLDYEETCCLSLNTLNVLFWLQLKKLIIYIESVFSKNKMQEKINEIWTSISKIPCNSAVYFKIPEEIVVKTFQKNSLIERMIGVRDETLQGWTEWICPENFTPKGNFTLKSYPTK